MAHQFGLDAARIGLLLGAGPIFGMIVGLAGGAWSRLFCRNLGITLPQLKPVIVAITTLGRNQSMTRAAFAAPARTTASIAVCSFSLLPGTSRVAKGRKFRSRIFESTAGRPSSRPDSSKTMHVSASYLVSKFRDEFEAHLDGAVVTLYEVVANFPDDPVREAAQFVVGEIFIAQKDYRGAIAELEALVAAVPRGVKVPDALLKIGLAQRSLGEEARARRSWERLVKDYPGSGAARQARALLRGKG